MDPAAAPKPQMPDRKPLRWDQRLREQPLVAGVIALVAVMGGLTLMKSFATDTAPWLVSFLTPLADLVASLTPSFWLGLLSGMLAFSVAFRVRAEARLQDQTDENKRLAERLEEMRQQAERNGLTERGTHVAELANRPAKQR